MDIFYNLIEKYWKDFILSSSKKEHVFIKDIKHVEEFENEYYKELNIKDNKVREFNENLIDTNCNYEVKYNAPDSIIKEIYDLINLYSENPNWEKIKFKLDILSKFSLKSNIELKKYIKDISKQDDSINILILGAGPTGLLLANRINSLFKNNTFPKINILILDNRVKEEGIKMPFTRNRIFGVNLHLFTKIFPKFSCLTNLLKRGGIEIKYLEMLLYVYASHYKIPMYFSKKYETEKDINKLLDKGNFKLFFDCTAGRFKNEYINNSINFIPKNINYENEFGKIIINEEENIVKMEWKNNDYRYWISIDSFNKKDNLNGRNELTLRIINSNDYALLKTFNNHCINSKYLKILTKYLVNSTLIKKFNKTYKKNKNRKMKLTVFEINMIHKIKISEIIKIKNKNILYIGAGDTNFQSHFVVGAGLNRFLTLFEKIIHLIPLINN